MHIDRISVSRVKSYTTCPLRYAAEQEGKGDNNAIHFVFGHVVHQALERYHADPSKDLLAYFDEAWIHHPISDMGYYSEGRAMLRNYLAEPSYHENPIAKDKEGKPIIEYYFKIPLNKDVIFSGVIDRGDKVSNSCLEIIDYKTSRQPYSRDELDGDIQMSGYNLAAKYLFPEYDEIKLSVLFLRHWKMQTERTEEQMEEVKQYLINTFYQIKYDDDPVPRINKYCGTCPVRHECPAYVKLTQHEKVLLGDFDENADAETLWAQLQDAQAKEKIFRNRREELEKAIENHLLKTDKKHLIIGGQRIYMDGQERSFYPYSLVEKTLGTKKAKQLARVSNEKVEQAVGSDKELRQKLEKGKIRYKTKATLKVGKIREDD